MEKGLFLTTSLFACMNDCTFVNDGPFINPGVLAILQAQVLVWSPNPFMWVSTNGDRKVLACIYCYLVTRNACIWWMIGQPVSLFTEMLSERYLALRVLFNDLQKHCTID